MKVAYRSNGTARAMMARALTTVGTRRAGRPMFPPRALSGLGCGCSHGLNGAGGPAVAPGPGALTADPSGLPYIPYEAAKRMGLGCLGDSATTGLIASKVAGAAATYGTGALVGTAAGTVGGAAFGAAAGSVVPIIGTAVGLVVGLLTSKLFGHANQAQIASDVATRLKYAEAYKQMAGQYAGRFYGVNELSAVWKGLIHEHVFPKNSSAGTCDVNACINGIRAKDGTCPNCGGTEAWADDLFSGALASPVQGFPGAIKSANGQGITNPVTIADQVLIPAWSGPDPNKFNIKWASPANSTNPSLVRQLMIDSLDSVEFNANQSLPLFYGANPNPTAAAAPAPAAVAPPPPPPVAVTAPPVSPAGAVNPQVIPAVPAVATQPQCAAPYVWNGTQCVLPNASQATGPAPAPAASTTPPAPSVPAGFTVVATDANGVPVYANPQGVLYQWNGTAMQQFTGALSGNASQAAQMQSAIQAALAQGYSAGQAAQAAVAQQAAAGNTVPAAIQSQVQDQAATTAAAPTVAAAGASFLTGNTGLIAIGLTLVGLAFATAKPAKSFKKGRRRG